MSGPSNTSIRTPRSRAVGLGSAHHGVGHFIVERISGLLLIPLALYGVFAAVRLAGAGYEGAAAFVGQPLNAVLLSLLLICGLIHVKHTMQVVIEDYIERFITKAALLVLNVSICVLAGALGVFAILKAAFTGAF